MHWLLLVFTLLAPVRHATQAERLHHAGVHCMDVLEREACAIENFEALLDERSPQRALMTDAILRLLKLYDAEGDADQLRDVLRKFWDAGMKLGSAGHVAYSARYFAEDLDVLINLDPPRIIASRFAEVLGPDPHDYMFSCDDTRRDALLRKWRHQRAQVIARERGESVERVLAEMDAKDARRRRTTKPHPTPIFLVASCPVAQALGDADLSGWHRMTGALHHGDARRSMGIAVIANLDEKLETAVARRTFKPLSADRWRVVGVTYEGQPVDVARLDENELTLATATEMDGLVRASGKRKRRMNKTLWRLVHEVPKDTGAFVVMTDDALEGLGARGKRRSRFLKLFLPRPDGLQMAAIFHDRLGLFARVPTDTPVRAGMLVDFAQRIVDGRASKDPKRAAWLENLDIAESEDGRAILLSYLLDPVRLKTLMSL